MNTAIFPGSFDPVHNGHLALARTAADLLGLDRVIFVPSGVSPNKRRKQRTPGKVRFEWIRKALDAENDPRLAVSDHESQHLVPTYTLETVQELGKGIPRENLFLLVGADTAARMERWPSHDQIVATARVISFGRIGAKGHQAGTIEAPRWDHSSTEIRELVAVEKPIDHLVPAAIADEIAEHFLAQAQQELAAKAAGSGPARQKTANRPSKPDEPTR